MFFDDFRAGQRFETGQKRLIADDIVAFARQWDPQDFHLDAEAAENSQFGGLIASGFHTLLTAFVLTLESDTWREAGMGSPGMDAIRWLKPVRPGDVLRVAVTVAETRASRSKPDRGVVTFDHEVLNQAEEAVMTYRTMVILQRKPA